MDLVHQNIRFFLSSESFFIFSFIPPRLKPEELVGKTIVVVANLKPAKLMGVESRGMFLATDTEEGLTLLGFDRPPKTGAKIR